MERRLFVKKTSILASGALIFPTGTILSAPPQNSSNLDLTPLFITSKKIIVKGLILDSKTHLPITTDINIKVKRNQFYSNNHLITALNGAYSIYSGFSNSEKISEKLFVKIKANGYKPYESNLYLTQKGCNIHSDQWQYNPDFKIEHCPINQEEDDSILSKFNFFLVKN
ncbi:hypothetical protein [Flavobacterium sp.]|uniref:hypothetical protein n=1 Tax=Flavobacterium sp. TaxID=239 RepID=UPI00326447E9